MRLRTVRLRRPMAVGVAAAMLVGVAAVATVASPAMAATHCDGYFPFTMTLSTPGNWSGTAGDDRVLITANNVTFNPVGGRDLICITATLNITVLSAGVGHVIIGGNGPDKIYGSNGADFIQGNGGDDLIAGNGGSDVIYGGDGNDYIRGLAGGTWEYPDSLHGGAGNDRVDGEFADNDTDELYGDSGTDAICGNGNDICYPDYGPATQTCL